MKLNRHAAGALAAAATLVVGGGVALGAANGGDRTTRCEQRVERIAERRGVTVDQLEASVKTRLLARIDAAEKAGRISSARAANLRERVSDGSLCGAAARVRVKIAARGMLAAGARFLGLDRAELRAQLPGHSLADLAEQQGKSASALEAAMVAPAKARLAKAVADGKVTKERAQAVLERLEQAAERLATHVFPAT
jgi:3-hydroxyacyl-CoA dehydrogenase